MFFDIDNRKTTASAAHKVATSKTQSLLSRPTLIHPPPPTPPLISPSLSVSSNKRRPLLQRHDSSSASASSSSNSSSCGGFGELAGGTTAECAAVCCCCPCGLVNLLYVTIYKLPAGLCRRALRRNGRKKLIKKGLLPPRTKGCYCGFDSTELHKYPATGKEELSPERKSEGEFSWEEDQEEEAMMKLEEEMWKTFYSSGFWRSPSQRE